VQDYHALHALLLKHWPAKANRPLLIGNDCNTNPSYLSSFLPLVEDVLDVTTYHHYDGYGTALSHRHFVNSRTKMGSRGLPVTESAAPHQCPLESVASYSIYADVRDCNVMTSHRAGPKDC